MLCKMAAVGVFFICVFCAFYVNICHAIPNFINGRPRGGMLRQPYVHPKTITSAVDQWFMQKLDHYNNADGRDWQQRYFVNDAFYRPGGPVFLMIGGEGEASPAWMHTGSWIEYAKVFNALCFQLEHRFYGKSHPTSDMSVENLKYLSSEQALADIAYFHTKITNSSSIRHDITDAKWVVFGGSYPGSLAAWVRMKYPHLIHAAVSTSGPLLAKVNFPEYLDVVRDSLQTAGNQCNAHIAAATSTVTQYLGTDDGRQKIKSMFKLCADLDINDSRYADDVSNLFETLAGNFEDVVQYNRDNRAFEGGRGGNITIDTVCGIMADSSLGSEVSRFAAVNSLTLSVHKEKCLDISYDNMISELRQTSWNSSASEGGRQWIYQTCTEFGFYQSSDLANQPFGHKFPLSFSTQQCRDIYGPDFTAQRIADGCEETNINYGARDLKISRVVFVHGSIDPWHALGITKDLNPDATAIYINGTAHCANMYPASAADPAQLTQARITIQKLIGSWLAQPA